MNKQFEFRMTHKTNVHFVFCTAKNADVARQALCAAYPAPAFLVDVEPVSVLPAHHIYSEIDATA